LEEGNKGRWIKGKVKGRGNQRKGDHGKGGSREEGYKR